jgi:hypothetical protein
MKTSQLTGAALDWAVTKCELPKGWSGAEIILGKDTDYSTDWRLGGAIIQREWINLTNEQEVWTAEIADDVPDGYVTMQGETALIAAMRCYVAQRIGDEIEVPDELINYV